MPSEVVCSPAATLLRRTRPISIAMTAFVAVAMWGYGGRGALFLMVFAPVMWLYDLRLHKCRMVFTSEYVDVLAILRRSRVPTTAIREILLSATPGIASAKTHDGGSAVMTMSANGVEMAAEKKIRVHQLDLLQRMYEGPRIHVYGRDGRMGINRSSESVKWGWNPMTRGEVFILLGTVAWGIVCAAYGGGQAA